METSRLEQQPKKQNKTLKFIWAHKFTFFLLLLVITVFLWASIKMNILENRFEYEKKQILSVYDSIAVTEMETTAKVFSWAVRSAMINENLEQVNEYFLNFIKEPHINKVQLIDAPSAKVLLSTDKKEEGNTVTESRILEAETTYHLNNSSNRTLIISPVMGLSSKIGILVIERKL